MLEFVAEVLRECSKQEYNGTYCGVTRRNDVKKNMLKAVIVTGLLAAMGSVQAEDEGSSQAEDDSGLGLGLAIKGSTLGNGFEIGKSLNENFNVRLGLSSLSQSDNQTIDDVEYDTELDFSSTALYLDYHPFKGTFHLTLGYINSANALNATAQPAIPVEIGTVIYQPGDIGQLDATIDFKSGPYLGFGWGNVPASGFGFSLELGILQSGAPKASLVASNLSAAITSNQAAMDSLNTALRKEEANMQADLNEFELFPVIAAGISYGF